MHSWREDTGNIAVFTALAMVVLLSAIALVTDIGVVFFEQTKLANALDAGALAGAQQLFAGTNVAQAAALSYVVQNHEQADNVVVNLAAGSVTVSRTQFVPLYFARVFGDTKATIAASSTASVGALQQGTGFVPLAVEQQNFSYGKSYALSQGAGEGSTGNYGFLALGGNGASTLEQNLMCGYGGTIAVGDSLPTETGVMDGPVRTAILYRLQQGVNDTFQTATETSPRMMLLPVIAGPWPNGKGTVTVVGFAAFYLDGLTYSGGHQQILGRFKQLVVPGIVGSSTEFGLYGVHLTH